MKAYKKNARTTHRASDRASPAPSLAVVPPPTAEPVQVPRADLQALDDEIVRLQYITDVASSAAEHHDDGALAEVLIDASCRLGEVAEKLRQLLDEGKRRQIESLVIEE